MQARTILVTVVALLAAGAVQAAVTIETVHVGDPGNAADPTAAHTGNPAGQGSVSYEYNIGKYEVTAGQYTAFLNAVGGVDTYGLYFWPMARNDLGSGIDRFGGGTVGAPYTYRVANDFVNRPVNYLSFWDACRFANWLANGQPTGAQGNGTTEDGTYTLNGYTGNDGRTIQRNPGSTWAVTSEDEWFKAAYYKGGGTDAGYWDYPTRSDTAPGRDVDDASGNNANYYTGSGPYPIDGIHYTTVVGEFQNSAGPYGTFDQGGNVLEVNEAITYQDSTQAYRGERGGPPNLYAWGRLNRLPATESDGTGFRVVQVPEPTSMALLVLGGLAMIRRRRK